MCVCMYVCMCVCVRAMNALIGGGERTGVMLFVCFCSVVLHYSFFYILFIFVCFHVCVCVCVV